MNPDDWLSTRAPGYRNLSDQEHKAILHFALLWSLFEANVLASNANVPSILKKCAEWEETNRLSTPGFEDCLNYFRGRYFKDGTTTNSYEGLRFRPNDQESLVRSVLSCQNRNPRDELAALFIIIYRLRNNLFHGEKWSYQLAGQFLNFSHANDALMEALSRYGGL
jgi:hypothetical protein